MQTMPLEQDVEVKATVLAMSEVGSKWSLRRFLETPFRLSSHTRDGNEILVCSEGTEEQFNLSRCAT